MRLRWQREQELGNRARRVTVEVEIAGDTDSAAMRARRYLKDSIEELEGPLSDLDLDEGETVAGERDPEPEREMGPAE